jgi:hypothetical protein
MLSPLSIIRTSVLFKLQGSHVAFSEANGKMLFSQIYNSCSGRVILVSVSLDATSDQFPT